MVGGFSFRCGQGALDVEGRGAEGEAGRARRAATTTGALLLTGHVSTG